MKKYLTVLILLIFFISSCDQEERFLDVNTDPLASNSADANLLFPEVLLNLSNTRTVENVGLSLISQHWASGGSAGVFINPERYTISSFTVGNTWGNYYVDGLKNLFLVIRDAGEGFENTRAQAIVLQAFFYLNITCIWEEVPFTEALNPADFPSPKFDNQRVVLEGIVKLVDEANTLFDESSVAVENGDLLYGGDVTLWRRFGNSIKLKALMMISNRDEQAVSATIASLMQDPLVTSLEHETVFQYYNTPGDYNPLWGVLNNFSGSENLFFSANTTLLDVMSNLSDPRIPVYFTEGDLDPDGQFDGIDPGVGSGGGESVGDRDFAYVSPNIIRPDAPDRYMTAAEVVLLQAEAAARGIISGGLAEANTLYRSGVQLALDYFDGTLAAISDSLKTAYISSLPNLTNTGITSAVETIRMQQYIEVFGRHTEAWTQWRRTKIPNLSLPEQATLGDIIRRYPWATDEAGANPNIPNQPDLDEPMWFESL